MSEPLREMFTDDELWLIYEAIEHRLNHAKSVLKNLPNSSEKANILDTIEKWGNKVSQLEKIKEDFYMELT